MVRIQSTLTQPKASHFNYILLLISLSMFTRENMSLESDLLNPSISVVYYIEKITSIGSDLG